MKFSIPGFWYLADDSDIDSAELDDEETIAKEEELAAREEALASQSNDCKISDQSESRAEIEQLALEAMQPIEDLIPPGYLEALTAEGGGSSGLGSLEESTPVSLVSLSPSGEDRPTPCSDFAPSQSLDKPAVSPMLTHLAKQPQDQIPQQIYSDTPNQDTKNEEPVVPTLVNSSEQVSLQSTIYSVNCCLNGPSTTYSA
ncbi:unnamed protein product [Protopolystoma xenopodis]|uniref:Uncharacterized protein n=1 Tax=Protopolystoma xenopodis TaxID=117903 RepID=A0A3S5AT22_9PLAT|nr:unnamed protein product [Protopolystoma xenopodis]